MKNQLIIIRRDQNGRYARETIEAEVCEHELIKPGHPEVVLFYSNASIPSYLFGDCLLMYCDQTPELFPMIRPRLFANPTWNPEIQSTIESVKKGLDHAQSEVGRYIEMVRDPTQLAPEFMENVKEFIQAQEAAHKARTTTTAVNSMQSKKQHLFPVKHINVARIRSGAKLFKQMTVKGRKGEKMLQSRIDSGAEAICVTPRLSSEVDAKDTGEFIYLSGIEQGLILAPVVEMEVEIDGQVFPIHAALFSGLNDVVGSEFLTDAGLFIEASKRGIKFVEVDG
jgi:predicted aspartyl protease